MNDPAGTRTGAIKSPPGRLAACIDVSVTLALWAYFIAGFAVLFGPFYILAAVFASDRQKIFQMLNHLFYRGFFMLSRVLMPRQAWRIDPDIRRIRSSVIVCNHISYIDAILLVSLFARHTTIVKNRLFGFPVLRQIMVTAGYLPAVSEGRLAGLLSRRLADLPGFFAAGGNLIVFPEGTRSRTGKIGAFNKGAFKIAKMCRAPVAVLKVRNTDRLFTPDKFRFNTCEANTVRLDLLACLSPDYDHPELTAKELMQTVRSLYRDDGGGRSGKK